MPTREELQRRIAELNNEINEVIDANRLSTVRKPVFFPMVSWIVAVGVTAWLFIGSRFFPAMPAWVPKMISEAVAKYVPHYLPYLGLLIGCYAMYWTARWVIYRLFNPRSYVASQQVVYELEMQRQSLLQKLRTMLDDDTEYRRK